MEIKDNQEDQPLHKYGVGDRLWYATHLEVTEVDVLELQYSVGGQASYIVRRDSPDSKKDEVFETQLYTSRKDALHAALRENDISQEIVNQNIRNEVSFLEKLQQASQRMRQFLCEEYIMEHRKDKQK